MTRPSVAPLPKAAVIFGARKSRPPPPRNCMMFMDIFPRFEGFSEQVFVALIEL
jgi:hypothetical protein